MKWIDINDIAIELSEKFSDVYPRYIIFKYKNKYVKEIEDFYD